MNNKDTPNPKELISVEILIFSENKENLKKLFDFMNINMNEDDINETSNTIINNNSFRNENEISSFTNESSNYFIDLKDDKREINIRLNFYKEFVIDKFFHCFIILSNSLDISHFTKAIDLFSQKIKKIVSNTVFDFLFLLLEESQNSLDGHKLNNKHFQEYLLKEKKSFLKEKNLEKFILVNLDYLDRKHYDSFISFMKMKIMKSYSKFPEYFMQKKPVVKFVKHSEIFNRIQGSLKKPGNSRDNQINLQKGDLKLGSFSTEEKEELITFEENKSIDHKLNLEYNLTNVKKNQIKGRNKSASANKSINSIPNSSDTNMCVSTIDIQGVNNLNQLAMRNKVPIPRGNLIVKKEKFDNFSLLKDLKKNAVIYSNLLCDKNAASKICSNSQNISFNINKSNINNANKSKEKNKLANSTYNTNTAFNNVKKIHHKRIYSEVNLANKIKFGDSLTANTDRSFEHAKNIIQKSKEKLMTIHFKYKNDGYTLCLTEKMSGFSIASDVNKIFHLNLQTDSLKYLANKIIRQINKFIKFLKNNPTNTIDTNLNKDFLIDMEKVFENKNSIHIKVEVTVGNNKIIFYIKQSEGSKYNLNLYVDEIIKSIQHKESYDINSLRNQITNTLLNSIKSK